MSSRVPRNRPANQPREPQRKPAHAPATRRLDLPQRAPSQASHQMQEAELTIAGVQRVVRQAQGAASLYTALTVLMLANAVDMCLTAFGVHAHGLALEVMPTMHAVLLWGGIPAFVAAKFFASAVETAFVLALWRYAKPTTRGELHVLLGGAWLAAWYMLAVVSVQVVQLVLMR